MFLLRKPIVLFAFLEMRFMCVSHDRSEEMSTPIYVAEDTDSSMQLWRVYCVGIGCLDLVMWMTWHLEGLNSMFHLWLQVQIIHLDSILVSKMLSFERPCFHYVQFWHMKNIFSLSLSLSAIANQFLKYARMHHLASLFSICPGGSGSLTRAAHELLDWSLQ